MSESYAKVVIFYRDIPAALDSFISLDGKMSYIKDGAKKIDGKMCPRITLNMDVIQKITDGKRLTGLVKILTLLETNNQIVCFKVIEQN